MTSLYKAIKGVNGIDNNTLKMLAISIECFHKASLVHDDIVDNDSEKSDELIINLKRSFPNQIYIASKNIGYGPGNNLGISYAKTEFALILNPDVKINREAVISMLSCAEKYQPRLLPRANQVE